MTADDSKSLPLGVLLPFLGYADGQLIPPPPTILLLLFRSFLLCFLSKSIHAADAGGVLDVRILYLFFLSGA